MNILQSKLYELGSGKVLVIKLINYPELKLLSNEHEEILTTFYSRIKSCLDNTGNVSCAYSDNKDLQEAYIILNTDQDNADALIYCIYLDLQLYYSNKMDGAHIHCAIASIDFDTNSTDPKIEQILSKAQYLLYLNKNTNSCLCSEEKMIDTALLIEDNNKLNTLRSSLKEQTLKFDYQPIIDRYSGGVEYYECLLRVQNESGEYISVGELIEKAEAKGLASIIDLTVIKMAIDELVATPSLYLSVNISSSGLLNKRLEQAIEHMFLCHNVAHRLIIEITETSLNQDLKSSKAFLDKLRKYGCRFALDDFGSGFTAFNQLLNLPIDIIKIDGAYVKTISNNKYSRYFIDTIISMAHDLKIKTVAEYVETKDIAQSLLDNTKIDSMQGNFFLPASKSAVIRNYRTI